MVWIIGDKGMLGTEISFLLKDNNINFIGTDKEVDITDLEQINSFAININIKWIINCAAYTNVDKAEDDIKACNKLNLLGAENISIFAGKINAKLIHISTDYVFNGNTEIPYKEDDLTSPIGVYGLSKCEGEQKIMMFHPSSYIIRTAWLYGKYGNNFVNMMLNLMNEKEEIKVVNDQHGSPTWAFDLANIIIKIINNNIPFGIYHYTNEDETTWYNFACEIFKLGKEFGIIKKDCKIISCTSDEYPSKVKRPKYSVLDKTKIKNTLGIKIPKWNDSLKDYLNICAS